MVDVVCTPGATPSGESTVPMELDNQQLVSEFNQMLQTGEAAQQVKDAWHEFLTMIGGWMFDRLEVEMFCGDDYYEPPEFEDTFVHEITSVFAIDEHGRETRYTYWSSPQPGVLSLHAPLMKDTKFRLAVRVLPKPNMASVPIFLYNRYKIAVLNLARHNIYLMPEREWTNINTALSYRRRIDNTVRQARAQLRDNRAPMRKELEVTPLGVLGAERYANALGGGCTDIDPFFRPGYYGGSLDRNHL